MPLRKAPAKGNAVVTIEGACARPQGFSAQDLANVHKYYQIPDVSKIDERLTGVGVRLRKLVDEVGPDMHARYITVQSEDGAFSACLPLDEISRTAILVYQKKKGTALAREDGGPVRFIIPYYADKCANVKGSTKLIISEEPMEDTRPSNKTEHEALHAAEKTPAG